MPGPGPGSGATPPVSLSSQVPVPVSASVSSAAAVASASGSRSFAAALRSLAQQAGPGGNERDHAAPREAERSVAEGHHNAGEKYT